MNKIELKAKLEKLGISDDMYSLDGSKGLDRTVLDHVVKWRVYDVNDRGGIDDDHYFNTEDDACEYVYEGMLRFKEMEDAIASRPPYVWPAEEEKRTFIASADRDIRVEKEGGENDTVNDKQ